MSAPNGLYYGSQLMMNSLRDMETMCQPGFPLTPKQTFFMSENRSKTSKLSYNNQRKQGAYVQNSKPGCEYMFSFWTLTETLVSALRTRASWSSSEEALQTVRNSQLWMETVFVTHLLKTSFKSHFWLFEYDAPFERGRHPLYNDTTIIFLSQS